MTKYRIKATYNRYIVERKGWFFWRNHLQRYGWDGSGYSVSYRSYSEAKDALENCLEREAAAAARAAAAADFKTRYYYPPLPTEEPVND
jgi:hypothetical protein